MAVDTSDFRNGMAIYVDGEVCQIVEFQHVKPGKGGAFVRTRLRRVKAGSVVEKTFRAGEKFDDAFIERREFQYLYKQGEDVVLMDMDTYEQVEVQPASLGDGAKFLKESLSVYALQCDGEVLGFELPNFVELVVERTDPAYRGDTVSGGSTKPATLESGAVVQVPYHIKEGDLVKVDTRTGDYLERVKAK